MFEYSHDAISQPLPVPVLDARITQPRFVVPVRKSSISDVTSMICGATSTFGISENVAALAASTLSLATPLPNVFQFAVSVQSMIIRCTRKRSDESPFVGVNKMSLAD